MIEAAYDKLRRRRAEGTTVTPLVAGVRRHPLPAFFVLAYALSWWPWAFGPRFAFYPFLAWGPLLAALIVTAIAQGRPGLRTLGRRLIKWRVGWPWYAVAIGVPLALGLAAVVLNVVFGAPAPPLARVLTLSNLTVVFAVRLIDPLDGPMGEELGWRGFALERLQAGRSPLAATLILAPFAAGWHLPLILAGDLSLPDLLGSISATILLAWVYFRTGGSVFMTIFTHAAEGLVRVRALDWTGQDAIRAEWLYDLLFVALAIGLLLLDQHTWRGDRRSAPTRPLSSIDTVPSRPR